MNIDHRAPSPFGATFRERYFHYATTENARIANFLNESLDVMLVFTGLFSTIVTAFLIESTKVLQPDPAETTVFLLLTMVQLQQKSHNNSIPLERPVTSEPLTIPVFLAPRYAIVVNILWFLALSLSLAAALLSLLAKEWLKHYAYFPLNDPAPRMLEHQKRLDAMKRWYGFEIIDLIPILLHISLFLFGAGLVIYLWRLNLGLSLVVLSVLTVVGLFYVSTSILAAVTDSTPFVTRVSRYVRLVASNIQRNFWKRSRHNTVVDVESAQNGRMHAGGKRTPSRQHISNRPSPLNPPSSSNLIELPSLPSLPNPPNPSSSPSSPNPLDTHGSTHPHHQRHLEQGPSQALRGLANQSYDSKAVIQILLWVYDVAGDEAADSLIEVMSTMHFDWGLEYSSQENYEHFNFTNRSGSRSQVPVFLRSLGHGDEQPHQSIRLYNMTARRINTLGNHIRPHENIDESFSTIMDRSTTVLTNLCVYICSRSIGWADWSGNKTMSILSDARGVLNDIWERDYPSLSNNTRASIIVAELKLMFLVASCLNSGSKWKPPNDTMEFHPNSFGEIIAFYNLTIARAAIHLMHHSEGTAPIDALKLVDLLDSIIQSTNCIVGLMSNTQTRSTQSPNAWSSSTRPHHLVSSQQDVAIQNGPLTITTLAGNSSIMRYRLHPIDYGLAGELTRLIFHPKESQLQPGVLNKVDHALRSILWVIFNKISSTKSLPSLIEAKKVQKAWVSDQELEFIDIDIFSTHKAMRIDEWCALRNQVLDSLPKLELESSSAIRKEQNTELQILIIATLYILHSGPGQVFENLEVVGDMVAIAGQHPPCLTTDLSRSCFWRLIRAINIHRVAIPVPTYILTPFRSTETPILTIPGVDELKCIVSLLVNQPVWSPGVATFLGDLTDTPSHCNVTYEYCYRTLEGLPSFLLVARTSDQQRWFQDPVSDFIISLVHKSAQESQDVGPLNPCALDGFLLATNFVLLAPPTAFTHGSATRARKKPHLSQLEQKSFAKDALRLLSDHEKSPLEDDANERERVHNGLQYVWGMISDKHSKSPDLDLQSVKSKLQGIAEAPVEQDHGHLGRIATGNDWNSNLEPESDTGNGPGQYMPSGQDETYFDV